MNPDDFVTIATGSSVQADQMKMYLESEGITVFLHGQFFGTAAPHLAAPGGAGAVRVQVPKSQERQARLLLDRGDNT